MLIRLRVSIVEIFHPNIDFQNMYIRKTRSSLRKKTHNHPSVGNHLGNRHQTNIIWHWRTPFSQWLSTFQIKATLPLAQRLAVVLHHAALIVIWGIDQPGVRSSHHSQSVLYYLGLNLSNRYSFTGTHGTSRDYCIRVGFSFDSVICIL